MTPNSVTPSPAPLSTAANAATDLSAALFAAQADRIKIQVEEIGTLWQQVKALQGEKLLAENKAKDAERATQDLHKRYSHLRLEAWLGLVRFAIVVVAVMLVFDRLPDVLKALPRAETPSKATGTPAALPPSAIAKSPVQNPTK